MILEQINPQLLALAEESDVVLKDIYKKIDYSAVDTILQYERIKAKSFLQNAIGEV